MTERIPVIFKLCAGEVTAVFPTLPGTVDPWTCTCYAHVGQHGSASIAWVRTAPPASPAQYAGLLHEVRRIYAPEFRLVVRRRLSQKDHATRRRYLIDSRSSRGIA